MKKLLFFLLMSGLFFSCVDKKMSEAQLLEYINSVNADSIKNHVAFLADDDLKGRLPGTPEYDIAMKYVADQYKKIGLKPLGDDPSSYLQKVILRSGKVDYSSSFLFIESRDTLDIGSDYSFLPNLNENESAFEGEIILAGFGIEAPELNHNDFTNLDIKNKIAVIFNGAPELFPSSERAYFSNLGTKLQTAAKNGAVGVILCFPPTERGSFSGLHQRMTERGNTGILNEDNEAIGRAVYSRELKFSAFIGWPTLSDLFNIPADTLWAKYNFGKGEIEQANRNTNLKGQITSTYFDFESANVVGLLEGTSKKDEYIVHSAHLDHVGIGKPVEGDSIYNGAHDNASGTSSMIEIARLYSGLPSKPNRSVLFVAVTAEEMGLLGSAYFAKNPPVPKNQIIANVNTDMPTLIAPLLSIEPLGANHSSIMNEVKQAAKMLSLDVSEDHMPEQVRFVRSDQYNFILEGVPSLHIKYGLKTEDSPTGLKDKIEDYTKNVYHKPSDELNDLFDFEAGRTYVKLQFLISYLINNADEKPSWNDGDFFGKFAK